MVYEWHRLHTIFTNVEPVHYNELPIDKGPTTMQTLDDAQQHLCARVTWLVEHAQFCFSLLTSCWSVLMWRHFLFSMRFFLCFKHVSSFYSPPLLWFVCGMCVPHIYIFEWVLVGVTDLTRCGKFALERKFFKEFPS